MSDAARKVQLVRPGQSPAPIMASDWYGASLKAEAMGDTRGPADFAAHAQEASEGFIRRMEDTPCSAVFRYRYTALDALVGGASPGSVTFLYARTGNGKTTFVLNVLDDEVMAGRGVTILPTESTPQDVYARWACLRVGEDFGYWSSFDAKRDMETGVLHPLEYERRWTAIRDEARRIRKDHGDPGQALVERSLDITPTIMRRAFYRAKAEGHQLIIIDHIDLIEPDDGDANSYKASVAAVKELLRLLRETGMNALVCSQADASLVKGTVMSQYDPPTLGNAYNGQHKNHAASVVLGLFRPRKAGVDAEVIRQINDRQRPPQDAFEPGRMGIIKNKDRNYGRDGQRCVLALDHGRLRDLSPDESRDLEAGQHAIRTG